MNNNKVIIVIGLVFVLLQVLFISHLILREPKTLSMECAFSFTRNTKGESKVNYTGQMALTLTSSGKGELYMIGKTSEVKPRKFHFAYSFVYHLDEEGVLKSKRTSFSTGANNELSEGLFSKQFLELDFQLVGGLRVNKFRNVYIINIPGFIVSTCAPVN